MAFADLETVPATESATELNKTNTTTSTTTSTVTDATDMFHNFSKLPVELRIKIYKLIPEARSIEVRFVKDGRHKRFRFISKTPAILHANQEARNEILQEYTIAFVDTKEKNLAVIDFKRDTVYISMESSTTQRNYLMTVMSQMAQVEYLAISAFHLSTEILHPSDAIIYRMPALKQIVALTVDSSVWKSCPGPCIYGKACIVDEVKLVGNIMNDDKRARLVSAFQKDKKRVKYLLDCLDSAKDGDLGFFDRSPGWNKDYEIPEIIHKGLCTKRVPHYKLRLC